jgi:leader peptidase (prepilin peptidase) / N-methyltransferase
LDKATLELLLSPAVLGVIGLCIGSFLNVVIHRLPVMMERAWLADVQGLLQERTALQRTLGTALTEADARQLHQAGERLQATLAALPALGLSRPASRCPACGTAIAWHHNLPLLGWLRLRGRCAACQAPISARYPVVEAATGLLFAAIAWTFGPSAQTAVYCAATALLIAAALIDLDTTYLPDSLTYPLMGLGLFAAWMGATPVGLESAALGLLWGYFALWAIAALYQAVRGVVGMAEGDFKLLAALGALLGVQNLLPILMLASVVGAGVGLFLVLRRGHQREVPIPFGPYLAGGGLAALFYGAPLQALWWPG